MGVAYLAISSTLHLDPFLCSLKLTAKLSLVERRAGAGLERGSLSRLTSGPAPLWQGEWRKQQLDVGCLNLWLLGLIPRCGCSQFNGIRTEEFLIIGTCEEFNSPIAVCCSAALPPREPGAVPLWFFSLSTTVHQCSGRRGETRLKPGHCRSHYEKFEPTTSEQLPVFSRTSCYYPCFSGWMNQHNFIKLAICYVSCTPRKAISETNDCKAPHNSRHELSLLQPALLRTVSPARAASGQRWQSAGDKQHLPFRQKTPEPRSHISGKMSLDLRSDPGRDHVIFLHLTPQSGVTGPAATWKRGCGYSRRWTRDFC